jgi:excisionase family DNA binding protein
MSDNAQSHLCPAKRVYSVDEIAEILDISKGSAYELIKEGQFRTVRIGSAIRVSKQSFDDWLDNQNQESEA